MKKLVRASGAAAPVAVLAAIVLCPPMARADDGFVLAQSSVHKLKVFADGGAGWCGLNLKLRMVLDADSPDAGNPQALVDVMNRLKTPIETDCAKANSADLAVFAQNKAQGTYKATKAGGWNFKSTAPQTAAARQPASLDAPNEQPANAAAPAATPSAAAPPPPPPPPPPAQAATQPGDVPGSHDPAFLKRYEGSKIISYQARPYDSYNLSIPDPKDPKNNTWTTIEGQVTRIFYKEPAGHGVLELLRNYEQALDDAGFSTLYEWVGGASRDFGGTFHDQPWQVPGGFMWTNLGLSGVQQMAYVSAEATKDNQHIVVAVYLQDYRQPTDVDYADKKVHFDPGELTVVVDVITAKAVEIKMVQVKASDMADALATKGTVDLYGILFDVDKTDIKPESAKTLDEVASETAASTA